MTVTAVKPSEYQTLVKEFNNAVKSFRLLPSATNYKRLENAMLAYQDYIHS